MTSTLKDTAAEKTLDLWTQALDTIEQRLIASELDVQTETADIISQLLPSHTATTATKVAESINLIHQVTMNSHSVDDNEILNKCPNMMKSSPQNNALFKSETNKTHFYLRSMRFTRNELIEVLDYYNANYFDPAFYQSWKDLIDRDNNPKQSYFVRYIGCTTRSPFERLREDILSAIRSPEAGSNRISNFYRSVNHVLSQNRSEQKIKNITRLYEFRTLLVNKNQIRHVDIESFAAGGRLTSQDVAYYTLVDNTEQILIHLFGREYLLNSQPGGYHASYRPSENDIDVIKNIIDNIYKRPEVNEQQIARTNETKGQLRTLYERYAQAVNAIVKNNRHHITDNHINLYIEQAITDATHFGGITPLVLFGKDITKEDFETMRKFTDGSRTGVLVDNLTKKAISLNQNNLAQDENIFSFVDFYPSLYQDNQELHSTLSANILQELHTQVVCTLGHLPAAVAFSDFHGSHRLPRADFSEVIGEPVIVNLDARFDYEDIENEPQDIHCILVPNYHPGRFKYGEASPLFYRVLFLVFVVAFGIRQCVVEIIEKDDNTLPPGTRLFCEAVVRLWRLKSENGISEILNEAKQALLDKLSGEGIERAAAMKSRTKTPFYKFDTFSESCREALGERIKQLGFTQGERNSLTRRTQAIAMLRFNYPSLRPLPIYRQERQDEWVAWFSQLPENKSILQTCNQEIQIARQTPVEGLTLNEVYYMNTLFGGPPDGWPRDDNTWMLDPDLRQLAKARKSNILKNSTKFAQANRLKIVKKVEALPAAEVFINWPVRMSSGKTRLGVRINGERLSEANGLYWSENIPNGEYLVTYDPDVEMNGLVLKQDSNAFNVIRMEDSSPYKVSEVTLFINSRTIYYPVYKKTLDLFGHRPIRELQQAEEQNRFFDPNRVLRVMWREQCLEGPRELYTTVGIQPENRVQDIIEQIINREETIGLDRVAWQQEINKGANLFNRYATSKMKSLIGANQFRAKRHAHTPVRGQGQRTGSVWALPQYRE